LSETYPHHFVFEQQQNQDLVVAVKVMDHQFEKQDP
jgi:hypothetical protein